MSVGRPCLVVLLVAAGAGPAIAGSSTVPFGPREYVRGTGTPETVIEQFPVCRPERAFRLRVENGPEGRPRVSSGVIVVNGAEVVREPDFNRQVGPFERSVALASATTLSVHVAGEPGGTVAVSVVSDIPCLEVAITDPPAGVRLRAGIVPVRGFVRGAPDIGVAVNGFPALVEGESFAGLVPLDSSMSELAAVATAPDGASAQARVAVSVEAAGDEVVRLRAAPSGGVAPLSVSFSVSSLAGITHMILDSRGTGSVDFEGANLEDQEFTYVQPGVFTPTVRVTDVDGAVHVATTVVHVYDQVVLDARLQALWQGFKDALRAGDIARALTFVHSDTRRRYEDVLGQLAAAVLANIDRDLTTIQLVEVGFAGAEYEMLREREGRMLSFAVWFNVDLDGLWRLRRF